MPLQWAKSLRTKLEATRGAGGTPVRIMTLTDASWTPSIATINPEEYRGNYWPSFQAAASTESNTLTWSGDLDFASAAWFGQTFIAGGVSATGSTSYTYAFGSAAQAAGTADNISSVVAEYGWVDVMSSGTPGVKLAYLLGDQLTIRWDKASSRVTFDATMVGGTAHADLTAFTGSPTAPAGTANALLSVSGTTVSIDASTIGSTADPYVQSVEWTLNNGVVPLYTLNGGTGPQLVARPSHRKWTLRIRRAFYNNNELAVWKTKAERKIRLVTTGPTLGSSAFKVTADWYAFPSDYSRTEADGFTVEEITYLPIYDSTAGLDFSWTVVTGEATIT